MTRRRRSPSAGRLRRWAARPVGLALVWTLLLPLTVGAEMQIMNWLEGETVSLTEGPRFYDYRAGTQTTWDVQADWNSGSFVDTQLSPDTGSVQLASAGPPFELCLNSGGPAFTGADGTVYQADAHFSGGGTYFFPAGINNTTDDPLWQRIRYAFSAGGVPTYTYAIPVPAAGSYEVEVGIMESFNFPPYQNQTDLTIEGVQVLNDYDPYNVTGGRFNPTWHTFATTTADTTIDLLVGHAGWYGALTFVCVRETGPGSVASTGTWTSPALDTTLTGTNVFGLIGAATTEPAGTDVQFRLSFGATAAAAAAGPFVGPDGTTSTSYDPNTPIGYTHDFVDRFVSVQAILSTSVPSTTPTLDTAWLTHDLAEVAAFTAPLSIPSSPTGQTGWLLRVRTDDAVLTSGTASIELLSSSGSGDLTIGTDHPTAQVDIVAGSVVQGSGPAFAIPPTAPHSISLTETAMLGGTSTVRWQADVGGVLVAHDIAVTFS